MMNKRLFEGTISIYVQIELDSAVIDVVDDEWRSGLYNLRTPESIAEHIAGNLIRGARLSMLDGWADQPDGNARIVNEDWRFDWMDEILEVE